MEHGARVEVRLVAPQPRRGTESAAQVITVDQPVWRADLFDRLDGTPGAFEAAHFHPHFVGVEPCPRHWAEQVKAAPWDWLHTSLSDVADIVVTASTSEAYSFLFKLLCDPGDAVLTARPELSDRAIASTTKVSDKTVGAVRRKLEDGAEIPHHQSRVGKDGVQQSVTWPRARKAKPAEPGKGRKHRPRAPETTHDEIESGLPLAPPQVPKSPEPASPPGPSNPPVEAAQPPDPIRDHLANILGAAAALSRVPDDVDFHRMATIVDVSKRLHLRSRVSRAMDVLQGMREALGEAIDGPTLNEQDQSDKVDDLSSLEITEKMPPLPG